MKSFCPITGLPLTTREGWYDQRLDEHFEARFVVIGKGILYSGPSGMADLDSAKSVLELKKDVVRHVSDGTGPYIQIEDYTRFQNASLEARKYFADYMLAEKRVRALIFCNLSPLLRIIVRIGSRLNTSNRKIHVVDGFAEAVQQALHLCRENEIDSGPFVFGKPIQFHHTARTLEPVALRSEKAWNVGSSRFRNRAVVVDDRILLSTASGYLGEDEVRQLSAMRKDVLQHLPNGKRVDYIVVDVFGVEGSDRRARRQQIESIRQWHQQHPVRMYIFYGVNIFITTVIRMVRPSLPFRLEVADDLHHAFAMVRADQQRMETQTSAEAENRTIEKTSIADKLLAFIDSLNWEKEGADQRLPESVAEDHPFYFVFKAILLIKAELDEVFREQRRTLIALEDSEKKYRELFEKGSDLLFFHNLDGTLMESNPAFKEGFGIGDDITGKLSVRDFIVERHKNEFNDYIARLLRHGHDTGITTIAAADGREIILEYNNLLVRNAAGQPAGVSGSARDISARIRAEKENRRLQEQLRQRQKLEAIGTLAGGIAHDFNNILSIVMGNAELALDLTPKTEATRVFLGEILTACTRARDVVRQLLTFSRKTAVHPKPMDMAPVVKESLRLLRSIIPRNIDFRYGIPAQLPAVAADPGHLHQIMINLCTNAADAMSQKGGVMEIDLEPVSLDENDLADLDISSGDYVRLTVTDTGHGISPKHLDRVFDPYFTTKDIGKGTGMGLATVHGIITGYRGGIRARQRPTGGMRFDLFFPVTQFEIEAEEKDVFVSPLTGNETILFVDDEEAIAELSRRHLESFGYKVACTTHPLEALRWFQETPDRFDLVITDMAMPHLTGDRLAEAILQIRPEKPIILCTGYSEIMTETRAKRMGIRAFMEKPLEKKDLARAVRNILDETAAADQRPRLIRDT